MRIVFPTYDLRFPRLLVSLLGICFVSSCVIVLDSLSLYKNDERFTKNDELYKNVNIFTKMMNDFEI